MFKKWNYTLNLNLLCFEETNFIIIVNKYEF